MSLSLPWCRLTSHPIMACSIESSTDMKKRWSLGKTAFSPLKQWKTLTSHSSKTRGSLGKTAFSPLKHMYLLFQQDRVFGQGSLLSLETHLPPLPTTQRGLRARQPSLPWNSLTSPSSKTKTAFSPLKPTYLPFQHGLQHRGQHGHEDVGPLGGEGLQHQLHDAQDEHDALCLEVRHQIGQGGRQHAGVLLKQSGIFGFSSWLKCCFTSTETLGLLGTGAQDAHLDFHTAPELQVFQVCILYALRSDSICTSDGECKWGIKGAGRE